jgi:hypothetical protein
MGWTMELFHGLKQLNQLSNKTDQFDDGDDGDDGEFNDEPFDILKDDDTSSREEQKGEDKNEMSKKHMFGHIINTSLFYPVISSLIISIYVLFSFVYRENIEYADTKI